MGVAGKHRRFHSGRAIGTPFFLVWDRSLEMPVWSGNRRSATAAVFNGSDTFGSPPYSRDDYARCARGTDTASPRCVGFLIDLTSESSK